MPYRVSGSIGRTGGSKGAGATARCGLLAGLVYGSTTLFPQCFNRRGSIQALEALAEACTEAAVCCKVAPGAAAAATAAAAAVGRRSPIILASMPPAAAHHQQRCCGMLCMV